MKQRFGPLFLVGCVAVACGQPPHPEPRAAHPPGAESARSGAEQAKYRFPETSRPWTVADYVHAKQALTAIELEQPDMLPKAKGPRHRVFAKLTDLDNVASAAKACGDDLESLLSLGESLGAISRLYAAGVARNLPYGEEYVRTSAAYLRVVVLQTDALVRVLGLTPDRVREDEVRLDGLVKMRYGLATCVFGVLRSPFQLPRIVMAEDVADALAPVLGEVSSMLLPEENSALRADVDKLAEVIGAGNASVEGMLASLDRSSPTVTVVAELQAEHRAYADEQRQRMGRIANGMRRPIEIGPEGSGVRYAFPDQSFSAVFDVAPNAMVFDDPGENGGVTSMALGIKDSVGFARSITCMQRAVPQPKTPEETAREILEGIGAKRVRRVRVSLLDGWETVVRNERSEALVRVVPRRAANCIIVAEYPHAIAETVRSQAEEFVDSVRIGEATAVPTRGPRLAPSGAR